MKTMPLLSFVLTLCFIAFSCSKEEETIKNYVSQGTIDAPYHIEANKTNTGTVSGDPKSSNSSSSYYVFTAPENGYYSISMENMDVDEEHQDRSDMWLSVEMSHVSAPVEIAAKYCIHANNQQTVWLGGCWKDAQYVITITNENTTFTDGTRSLAYPKKFDFKIFRNNNDILEGSMDKPKMLNLDFDFSYVGECYIKLYDLFKSNIERADYHFNSEMADTYDEGLAVENIKVEIYKNDFQQNNIIRTIEGKIDEVKFDLEDFAQKDTAYLHIYSPDNRYWGKWKINRKITSID